MTPPNHIQKTILKQEIDLSAIAKGYAVDQIAELLHNKGYQDYMIDIGGEVRTAGHNPKGNLWKIAIEQPDADRGAYSAILTLDNLAIATSGDYRNYYEANGVRISHTIDPRTGSSITHTLASVSVAHKSTMMADAWATALNVLGPQEALSYAQKYNLQVMLIIRNPNGDYDVKYSPLMKPLIYH